MRRHVLAPVHRGARRSGLPRLGDPTAQGQLPGELRLYRLTPVARQNRSGWRYSARTKRALPVSGWRRRSIPRPHDTEEPEMTGTIWETPRSNRKFSAAHLGLALLTGA